MTTPEDIESPIESEASKPLESEVPPAPAPKKAAAKKKRAAKKKTAAKKAVKKAAPSEEVEPSSEPSQGELLYSSDGDGDFDKEYPGDTSAEAESKAALSNEEKLPAAEEAAPKQEAGEAEGNRDPRPKEEAVSAQHSGSNGRQDGKAQHQHQQRQKGHNKQHQKQPFNKNNKKQKGKPQQQQKQKQKQRKPRRRIDDEPTINYGELPVDQNLQTFEQLTELAATLAEGEKEALNFVEAYQLALPDLLERVEAEGLVFSNAPNRNQMIKRLMEKAFEEKRSIEVEGVLDILEDDEGGVLAFQSDNYRLKELSVYVPLALIRHYGLLQGHIVKGTMHPPRETESCPFLVKVDTVMGRDPDSITSIVPFKERVPYYPTTRILLESTPESDFEIKWDNVSMRTIDCMAPIGFGQRGLIVAPPRTGKTVILQGIANSIQNNYPDAHLIILLVDERPEEVTDFRRQCRGEVIASTFDESAESHVHAAEMVIAKARRMVECGRDVVILLDSITRLARAYNTTQPNSGKILSGGVEANALQKPKRFFGSARNIEDGGSLTILGTALVETGSKMDEVIFEEFKGTGNMELHLDRALVDKRIFPAMSFEKSGTRKEELLYHPDEMQKIYSLRRAMKGIPSTEAMEMLIARLKRTKTNAEFLMTLSR